MLAQMASQPGRFTAPFPPPALILILQTINELHFPLT